MSKPTVVTDTDPQATAHEETIIPVKLGLARVKPVTAARQRDSRHSRLLVGTALVVSLLLALAVIFVLPLWVAEQQPEEPVLALPVEVLPEEPEGPVLTAAELATLRDQAEKLLAELLTQQARLDGLAAAEWGGDAWEEYQQSSRAGDDAYLADAFQDAVPAYANALQIGEQLLGRSAEIITAALSAGNAALDAGNARLALEQFQLVIGIEAGNVPAQAGLERAERLPEVLVLVQQGTELERQGDLEEAARAFRAALGLDPSWAPARSALTAVTARIDNRRFETRMSQGLTALAEEEFAAALELFGEALILRPGSAEALDGQIQAQQGQKLEQIALVEARALAFERRELWERAIQLYRDLLVTDATLVFAQAGLERSVLRADLEAKLVNLIGNPTLLFDDRVLADAGGLVADARSVEDPGPRLEEQIADLNRLVVLASTLVTVELHSDELTNVTLYRVGELGTFAVTQVQIRPGNYTAVGSRHGYRDVRTTFTVLPGRELAPVEVRCVEPIG